MQSAYPTVPVSAVIASIILIQIIRWGCCSTPSEDMQSAYPTVPVSAVIASIILIQIIYYSILKKLIWYHVFLCDTDDF